MNVPDKLIRLLYKRVLVTSNSRYNPNSFEKGPIRFKAEIVILLTFDHSSIMWLHLASVSHPAIIESNAQWLSHTLLRFKWPCLQFVHSLAVSLTTREERQFVLFVVTCYIAVCISTTMYYVQMTMGSHGAERCQYIFCTPILATWANILYDPK